MSHQSNSNKIIGTNIIILLAISLIFPRVTGEIESNTKRYSVVSEHPTLTPTLTPTLLTAPDFEFPLGAPDGMGYGHTSSNGYDTQNPNLGSDGKCFVNIEGTRVPWKNLYHAGTDWFYLSSPTETANTDVTSIGNGLVVYKEFVNYPGWVLIIKHRLPNNEIYYSQYGHITSVQVNVGDIVLKGEKIGTVLNQGDNSHLHWEVRTFGLDAVMHF